MSYLLGASEYSATSMEGYVGVRKGAWTEEEDKLLRKCIEKYGKIKWHQVPVRAGLNRCRKSCRLRWLNYLKPNIKRGEFMEDEVDLILRLQKLLGNRWSLIAGRLPGRTANDVKNYWNAQLRKKAVVSKQESKAMTSTTQNTQKINVIKPQPRTFSKKTSVWVNAKITVEENSRDNLEHPNLCKASSSTSLDTPDNNEMIWWERLLESGGQLVQETPNSMGWSEGPTSAMCSFWAETSPLRTTFAGCTGFEVDQNCLGNHHDINFDANVWNLLNAEDDSAINGHGPHQKLQSY